MKHLLSSSAFLIVNKHIAKEIGLKATILLSDLISKEQYFEDDWFFNTESNITQDTTLTPYQQRKALKTLLKYQIIEVKRMGVPAKKHFKINEEQVIKLLNNKLSKNLTTNNKNKVIKINNKDLLKGRFGEEVSCLSAEIGLSIEDANDFLLYWTELNRSGTKMRFELQKTWETKRRLQTWLKNSKKFNKSTSKIDKQLDEYLKGKELL